LKEEEAEARQGSGRPRSIVSGPGEMSLPSDMAMTSRATTSPLRTGTAGNSPFFYFCMYLSYILHYVSTNHGTHVLFYSSP
jgi:hypothetical protein